MSDSVILVVLVLVALAWIRLGWVGNDPEKQLELLGHDHEGQIQEEMRKDRGLSRREAARRVLQAIRRDSD